MRDGVFALLGTLLGGVITFLTANRTAASAERINQERIRHERSEAWRERAAKAYADALAVADWLTEDSAWSVAAGRQRETDQRETLEPLGSMARHDLRQVAALVDDEGLAVAAEQVADLLGRQLTVWRECRSAAEVEITGIATGSPIRAARSFEEVGRELYKARDQTRESLRSFLLAVRG